MTGLVRKATLLALCGVLLATVAMAGVPSRDKSEVPACFTIVGQVGGVPDAYGQFTVTVRDLANNLLPGSNVCVDVAPCTDIHICADQLDVNATVNCNNGTSCKITDGAGQVTFIVVGGANNGGASPGCGTTSPPYLGPFVKVEADGVVIGEPITPVLDEDGNFGMGANDLAAWIEDFAQGYWVRSDFDCDGSLGANDLAIWLDQFGFGNSASSCPEYPASSCPPGR